MVGLSMLSPSLTASIVSATLALAILTGSPFKTFGWDLVTRGCYHSLEHHMASDNSQTHNLRVLLATKTGNLHVGC